MLRWVFIHPRNLSPFYDPETQEPLGLEALAASRRSRGDRTLILDSCLDILTDTRLARRAVAFRPDFIGFSIMTAQQLDSVLAIHAEACRALHGRPVRWLAGGNFVSTEPGPAQKLLPKDVQLVLYEGENALERLARDIEAPSRERVVRGEPVDDLDALPRPLRPYLPIVQGNGWAVNLQGSRGCCGACRYCTSPGVRRGAGWRGRSPGHIADEVAALHREEGAATFNFIDEDFLGPAPGERAEGLAEEFGRRGLRVSFGIQVRPTSLNETVLRLLRQAGVAYIFMGIESDNPEDLRGWGRPGVADPWRLVRLIRGQGMELNVGAILFHPDSTLPGVRRFATRLHALDLLDYRTATNRMDAMPGSTYHKQGIESGDLDPDAAGPQTLPFNDPAMEALHEDFIEALAPIEPVSMQAVCSLPPLTTRRFLSGEVNADYETLKGIIACLDEAVANTVFALLEEHERKPGHSARRRDLRRRNLDVAAAAADRLARAGFSPFPEQLAEALRQHSGT